MPQAHRLTPTDSPPGPIGRWFRRTWYLLVGGVAFAGIIFWVYRHTEDPGVAHDSALDAVFDSRLMVAGARVAVAASIGFLLLSILVLVRRGQWLRGAGPFQAGDRPEQKIADDQVDLQRQLAEAKRTIKELDEQLAQSLAAQRGLLDTLSESSNRGGRRRARKGHHDDD